MVSLFFSYFHVWFQISQGARYHQHVISFSLKDLVCKPSLKPFLPYLLNLSFHVKLDNMAEDEHYCGIGNMNHFDCFRIRALDSTFHSKMISTKLQMQYDTDSWR